MGMVSSDKQMELLETMAKTKLAIGLLIWVVESLIGIVLGGLKLAR